MKRAVKAKQADNVKSDLTKYEKIASSKYAQDMKGAAWRALIACYPEAKKVPVGNVKGFLAALGLTRDNEDIITFKQKRQLDEQRRVDEKMRVTEKRRILAEKAKKTRNGFYFRDDAIVVDELTGLMWARNGNVAGKGMSWNDAMSWVKNLDYGGYSDWRLPTHDELDAFSARRETPFSVV